MYLNNYICTYNIIIYACTKIYVLLRCVLQKKASHWNKKFKINHSIKDTAELQLHHS